MYYINTKLRLPSKGRKATTSKKLFIKAMYDTLETDEDVAEAFSESEEDDKKNVLRYIGPIISKDCSIEVDTENMYYGWFDGSTKEPMEICGQDPEDFIEMLDMDEKYQIPFIRISACGDWEDAVALIVYANPEGDLRVYCPRCGNVFNNINKKAIGNDSKLDEKFIRSELPSASGDYDDIRQDIVAEETRLFSDITARLIPVASGEEESVAGSSSSPKPGKGSPKTSAKPTIDATDFMKAIKKGLEDSGILVLEGSSAEKIDLKTVTDAINAISDSEGLVWQKLKTSGQNIFTFEHSKYKIVVAADKTISVYVELGLDKPANKHILEEVIKKAKELKIKKEEE